MSDNTLPRIGFMGIGIMGAPMAGHLMAAGYAVTLGNRSRDPPPEVAAHAAYPDDRQMPNVAA